MTDIPASNHADDRRENLPQDVATLHHLIRELTASLQQRDRDNETLRQQIDRLLRRLYGPRNERVDSSQILLFDLCAAASTDNASPPAEDTNATSSPRRCRPLGEFGEPQWLR
jgi:septal ring factor EnvC (AmiA/AmiB activator)